MFEPTVSRFPALPRGAGARIASLLLLFLTQGCGSNIESRMSEVRALQDVGQFEASIGELTEVLTLDPDLPEANYRLGLAMMRTGEPMSAVFNLKKATESSEWEIKAGLLLINAHFSTNNFDQAVRAADRVLERDPDRQGALRLRAQANLSSRQLEAAHADAVRLVELLPDDYSVRALHATTLADIGELEEAEQAHLLVREIGEKSDDPSIRQRACIAPAVFADEVLKDREKARGFYEECLAKNPTESVVLTQILRFFDAVGERERGAEIYRKSIEQDPENVGLRQALANRLRNTGDIEGAEQVLTESVEIFGTAAAWNQLAAFYRAQKQPEKALEAIEKVRESGGKGDSVLFIYADVLIDLGELERANEVAEQLKESTYATLIRGRIRLLEGDAKGALEAFEHGIRAWPTNAGARFLAGLAARDLGDYERAMSELRESVRASKTETEAALELARIHLALRQYQSAANFANMALQGPGGPRQSEAYLVAIRAFTELEQLDRVRASIRALKAAGHDAIAITELATLEQRVSGPEKALQVIQASKLDATDPANEMLLRKHVETLVVLGRGDEALAKIGEALARSDDSSALHELHGTALARLGQTASARTAYERALSLDAENAGALAGFGTLAANGGDLAQAVASFDRAAKIRPDEGAYSYAAAQLILSGGDTTEAESRLRHVIQFAPSNVGARNDLAWILAEQGRDLDYALSIAREARRIDASPEILDTLGWVHLKRGEAAEAVGVFEQAVTARPESASMRYRLGKALVAAGETERGRNALREALELGTFDEADDARQTLAQLES